MALDLERGLLKAVLIEGYDKFQREEHSAEIFSSNQKKVLEFIEKHYLEYGVTPSMQVVESYSDTSFRDVPLEKMSFWINLLTRRYAYNQLKRLKDKAEKKLEQEAHDDVFKVIVEIAHDIEKLQQIGNTDNVCDLFDPDVIDRVLREKEAFFIETPWPSLNRSIKGFHLQDLTILCGRPGTGKTWQMMNCLAHASNSGHSCLLVTTEMRTEAMMERFWATYFKVSYEDLRERRFPDYALNWMKSIAQEKFNKPDGFVKLMGKNKSGFQLRIEDIAKIVMLSKPKLVMIDGAYLLKSDKIKYNEKHNQVGEIFNLIKAMAMVLDVSIIVTTQLNRPQNETSKAGLHRLAFSDNLGMVADNVLMLTEEGEDNDKQKYIEPVKLREGKPIDKIPFKFDFNEMDFGEDVSSV